MQCSIYCEALSSSQSLLSWRGSSQHVAAQKQRAASLVRGNEKAKEMKHKALCSEWAEVKIIAVPNQYTHLGNSGTRVPAFSVRLPISIDRLYRSLLDISAWTGCQRKCLCQCLSWIVIGIVIPQAALQDCSAAFTLTDRLAPPLSSCFPPLVCINSIFLKSRLSKVWPADSIASVLLVCVYAHADVSNIELTILKSQPHAAWAVTACSWGSTSCGIRLFMAYSQQHGSAALTDFLLVNLSTVKFNLI